MDLEEFMKILRKKVDGFESSWKEENDKNPKNYPMAFEEGEPEWWMQWEAWMEMGDG